MADAAVTRDLRFLDPAVIARLGNMELKARTVVEGFLSGLHRSPYKGFSVEFAEYRQYLPVSPRTPVITPCTASAEMERGLRLCACSTIRCTADA